MSIASKQMRFRGRFLDNITRADFDDVIRTMLRRAKDGDKDAMKLFLSYAMGLPTQPLEINAGAGTVTFALHIGNGDRQIDASEDDPIRSPPALP